MSVGWLRDLLGITDLTTKVDHMASQADIDNLAARVDAVGTAVSTGVSAIRQDIADIRAANPAVDLTALEASVATLEASAQGVTDLDAEYPAEPTPEPTPEPDPEV